MNSELEKRLQLNSDHYYRAHILYMEDDIGLGRLLQKHMERLACLVDIAQDGRKGLGLAVNGSYDIVIADYNMPGANGLEVLQSLKGSIPVIILTGQGDEKIAVEAMKLGAADYVSKDINGEFIELLPSIIDRVMEREQLIQDRKQAVIDLQASEARYRAIVEDQTEMICRVQPEGKLVFANAAFCRYFGIPQSDVAFHSLATILTRNISQDLKESLKRLTRQNPVATCAHSLRTIEGKVHWLQWTSRGIYDEDHHLMEYQLVGRDITELKRVEEALRESEEKNSILLNAIPDPILRVDSHGICLDLRPKNGQGLELSPECVGKSIAEFFPLDVVELMLDHLQKVFQEETSQVFQFKIQQGDNIGYQEARLVFAGKNEALVILRDVTERSKLEQQLQYLNIHDSLTGLYNRVYFQEEMHRLTSSRHSSVGIVVCDVDALKIVNDNLGHSFGDQLLIAAADVMRQAFRTEDAVARIGGDEFAVLVPNVSQAVVDEACSRLRQAIAENNAANPELFLSISVGVAVSVDPRADLGEIFQQADEAMYADKLRRSMAVREAMVQSLKQRLERKGLGIKEHAERVKTIMRKFAQALGFSEDIKAELDLFAEYHDIGKVVLPESILTSRERITAEEYMVIKRHCEAGHKIALAVPKLVPVADWILKHHEWWDGSGYPLGIQGQEIPIESRMLTIADSYESMTSGRLSTAKSYEEALDEVKRCAGTQFDPELVKIFIRSDCGRL